MAGLRYCLVVVRTLKSLSLLGALALGFGLACTSDTLDYRCTVTWTETEGGAAVGSVTFDYDQVPSADDAVSMCVSDQDGHPDKPANGNFHSCDCQSK